MLRASSLGLSFAFSTAIRSRPWNATYRTKAQARPLHSREIALCTRLAPRNHEGDGVELEAFSLSHSLPKKHIIGDLHDERHTAPEASTDYHKLKLFPKAAFRETKSAVYSPACACRNPAGLIHLKKIMAFNRKRRCRIGRCRSSRRYYFVPQRPVFVSGREPVVLPPEGVLVFRRQNRGVKPVHFQYSRLRAYLKRVDSACYAKNEDPLSPQILRLLRTVGTSHDLQKAWEAFLELTHLQNEHDTIRDHFPRPPLEILHRLCRFIARSRPITRLHFPCLLNVTQRLWDVGGEVKLEEWNSLINLAGKGHRNGSRADYQRALSLFHDLIAARRPGSALAKKCEPETLQSLRHVNPDIYTFNTLLDIAAKSLCKRSLRDAVALFNQSGQIPNRITHLSLLGYYTKRKQLNGVRSTIAKMQQQKLQLGIDGLNACIWAYTLNERHDVALDIYRVLRNNVLPDPDQEGLCEAVVRLGTRERLAIAANLKPDTATYTSMIQSMAYRGDFIHTFTIFADMVAFKAHGRLDPVTAAPFRAIFLGFAKYAVDPLVPHLPFEASQSKWNFTNLLRVYKLFLKLPISQAPTRSTLYWIMVAFDKTSGHDRELLRKVWTELEDRYLDRHPLLFTQPRIRRIRASLFPEAGKHG